LIFILTHGSQPILKTHENRTDKLMIHGKTPSPQDDNQPRPSPVLIPSEKVYSMSPYYTDETSNINHSGS